MSQPDITRRGDHYLIRADTLDGLFVVIPGAARIVDTIDPVRGTYTSQVYLERNIMADETPVPEEVKQETPPEAENTALPTDAVHMVVDGSGQGVTERDALADSLAEVADEIRQSRQQDELTRLRQRVAELEAQIAPPPGQKGELTWDRLKTVEIRRDYFKQEYNHAVALLEASDKRNTELTTALKDDLCGMGYDLLAADAIGGEQHMEALCGERRKNETLEELKAVKDDNIRLRGEIARQQAQRPVMTNGEQPKIGVYELLSERTERNGKPGYFIFADIERDQKPKSVTGTIVTTGEAVSSGTLAARAWETVRTDPTISPDAKVSALRKHVAAVGGDAFEQYLLGEFGRND